MSSQNLGDYNNSWFERGRPRWVEILWILASLLINSGVPGSKVRIFILSLFGADIATGVVIKSRVRITFPWRLSVGKDSWIGEGVWLDNLAQVEIGSDCCLSQGAYICTGNHDWSSKNFDLVLKPVSIMDGTWVGAFARIAPGVTLGENSVVAMGGVITGDVPESAVYGGNPATLIKARD
jgi:putative colanic acid biosynthesis acetyltransferase WcaF